MTAPQPPTSSRSLSLAGSSLLLLLGGAGMAWVLPGCSQEPPPPAPTPAPAPANPLDDLAHKPTIRDPMELLGGGDVPAPVHFTLPVLPFEERSEGLPTSGTWRGYPLLHDFTHDGRADLVVSNREEDGYNAWEAPAAGPWIRRIEGLEPRSMAYGPARAADMNEDGNDDLVLSAHTTALGIYLNDGKMNWKRSESPIANPYLMIDVAVGNLNGDAHKDVVGIGQFKGGVSVYLGDGKGGLQRLNESASILPGDQEDHMGKVIELADIDGDGIDDIVATTNTGLKVFLTKPGQPMKWVDVSRGLPNPKIGNSIYVARVARILPDAWPQIVMGLLCDPGDTGQDKNGIGVYRYDPDKKEWAHADTGLDRSWETRDLAVGDLDDDGKLDLVVMAPPGGGVIYRGLGNGAFEAYGRLDGVHGKCNVTLGDVDGDKHLDVLVSTGAAKDTPELGNLRVFLNRPQVWKR